MHMDHMIKKISLNIILVILGILVGYGLLEAMIRVSLPFMPRNVFNNQCRELRTLGQTSKSGVTPEAPYVAIIGDSYGAGQGDWFVDNHYRADTKYQATHVLHDETGKDVISLSRAGSGSYDGAAIYAINTFLYLKEMGFDMPAPESVIVYFYEGNDIGNNLGFVSRHFTPIFDREELFDDGVFSRFESMMRKRHVQGNLPRTQDIFLAGNLISRYIEGLI